MSPENSPVDLEQMLSAWLAANEARDAKAFTSFFVPDPVYEDMALKCTFRNHAEVEKWFTDWFEAYPDFTIELRNGFVAGNHAVMEWEFTATLEGSFYGVPDTMRGKRRTVPGASVIEFDDTGRIRAQRDYWHVPDLST